MLNGACSVSSSVAPLAGSRGSRGTRGGSRGKSPQRPQRPEMPQRFKMANISNLVEGLRMEGTMPPGLYSPGYLDSFSGTLGEAQAARFYQVGLLDHVHALPHPQQPHHAAALAWCLLAQPLLCCGWGVSNSCSQPTSLAFVLCRPSSWRTRWRQLWTTVEGVSVQHA
jgi:hypothetical protein